MSVRCVRYVQAVAERCSRTQCSAPAAARVAFDALTCFVWIDPFEADGPLDVSARGAGALCARHADRLVAPRGWAVQDRRGRDLQLWSERPATDLDLIATSARTARTSRTAPTNVDGAQVDSTHAVIMLEQHLPFDGANAAAATAAPAEAAIAPGHGPRSEPTSISSTTGDDIDVVLDAVRSPMLSRAFNAARSRHAG